MRSAGDMYEGSSGFAKAVDSMRLCLCITEPLSTYSQGVR